MIAFRCKHCGRDAPPEWGAERSCPEHPGKKSLVRKCEYDAVAFTATELAALFSHRHVDLAALSSGTTKLRPFLDEFTPEGGAKSSSSRARRPPAASGLDPDCAPRNEPLDAAYKRAVAVPAPREDELMEALENLVSYAENLPPRDADLWHGWDDFQTNIKAARAALSSARERRGQDDG